LRISHVAAADPKLDFRLGPKEAETMTLLYAALLLAGAPTASPPAPPPEAASPAQSESADGRDAANAIKVDSVDEEYVILRRLGLVPRMQSLMMIDDRPYDMIRAEDPRTGKIRELWFDIQSFFGKDF
jgi:hypothetical protein